MGECERREEVKAQVQRMMGRGCNSTLKGRGWTLSRSLRTVWSESSEASSGDDSDDGGDEDDASDISATLTHR